jgi:hypothetical protein
MKAQTGYHGVKTVASMHYYSSGVTESVSSASSGVTNIKIIERMQRFILVWAIGALHRAANDPYTQEHPKLGGYNRV